MLTPSQALSIILRAYHDQTPLTLDDFDEAFQALPPDCQIVRGDGQVDVHMSLNATWRYLWREPPMFSSAPIRNTADERTQPDDISGAITMTDNANTTDSTKNIDPQAELDRMTAEVKRNLDAGHLYYTQAGKDLTTVSGIIDTWHSNNPVSMKLNPKVATILTTR